MYKHTHGVLLLLRYKRAIVIFSFFPFLLISISAFCRVFCFFFIRCTVDNIKKWELKAFLKLLLMVYGLYLINFMLWHLITSFVYYYVKIEWEGKTSTMLKDSIKRALKHQQFISSFNFVAHSRSPLLWSFLKVFFLVFYCS